jgi:peptidoglycan/xylan/chitin deacetylase (PgdA/CDA1 family)
MKNNLLILFLLIVFRWAYGYSQNRIITRLPTNDSVLALTFDACETVTPSYFDSTILNYLIREQIACTIFVGGKFAVRNRSRLKELSALEFIEMENHSFHHYQHMELLNGTEIVDEVTRTADTMQAITGKRPKFFRFPGGNYDEKSLKAVEELGYRIVHWSFESGDPDKKATPEHLIEWVLYKTKPAGVLIFHINGRGYSTGKALPAIIEALRKKHYRFVKLTDYLN